MTKILFIVNDIAGGKSKRGLPGIIRRHLDSEKFQWELEHTQYKGHATELARETDADWVVAVGGDGTVNEVARGVIGTEKALGIIPCGSGDGLALHLGISRLMHLAVRSLNSAEPVRADYGLVNGEPFFCTCGVGLDAIVSMKFAQASHRGLPVYIEKAIETWHGFEPETYRIGIDGESVDVKAVLITAGNANQWGNYSKIAPAASVRDGLLDVSVIGPFKSTRIPVLATELIAGKINQDHSVRHFRCRKLHIHRESEGAAHFDGDPLILGKDIEVEIVPGGILLLPPASKMKTI